jgi:hypothetical protein
MWICDDTDVGHGAYLTVEGSQDVDTSHVKDHSDEGGNTCEGVDLCVTVWEG